MESLADRAARLSELLATPTGNHKHVSAPTPETATVEVTRDGVVITTPAAMMESAAADVLRKEGLDPEHWEVTRFKRSEWGEGKVSTRYEFRRTAPASTLAAALSDAELTLVHSISAAEETPQNGSQGFTTAVVCIADTQLGKYESPAADALSRVFLAINVAVARVAKMEPEHVVVAFMGDHVEGFVSQGGANAWRTQMPLTEQIRLTRRMMIYAMDRFETLGIPMSMVAVPGNHDQAVKFGKGITTYNDSHDVESLIAVSDAAALTERFKRVKFLVPETDEISVSMNLSGTHTVFTHGYFAKPGKYHEWVKGQAYNRHSLYHGCDLVVMGHWHTFHMSQDTDRTVIVAPAAETE